jgi:hypothetical protein
VVEWCGPPLEDRMTDAFHEGSIASLTPTICSLFGVAAPAVSNEKPLDSVLRYATDQLDGRSLERCLIYCPDALGNHLWSQFPGHRERISACCPHRVAVSAVFPPKTPVCFASVFTGAPPEVHGIRRYERPVLSCDTLFDAFARTGRRVAIVAVRESSIDIIFRNRALDYFSESDDSEVTARAVSLLAADSHDLIVAYHQEYDDQVHRTQPFSPTAVRAMHNHVASVELLTEAARSSWSKHSFAMAVAPDHGAHLDPETGRGDHGLDVLEDMSVSHWYGIFGPRGHARR